jgi:Rha family phage regulatory protein
MSNNPELAAVLEELAAVGIKPHVSNGGKHIKVAWTHNGMPRIQGVACTPSDARGVQNARARVRRALKEDGLLAAEEGPAMPKPHLTVVNGAVVASSLDVAAHFSKSHKDVLRAIDRICEETGAEFAARNFAPSSYIDASGRSLRAFNLTRDGLSMLVMGFTGAAATRWKMAYIEAFNAMEAELKSAAVLEQAAPGLIARVDRLASELSALVDLSLETATTTVPAKARGYTPPALRRQRARIEARRAA